MGKNSKSTVITLTILLGVALQVLFAAVDSVDTPDKAAVRFTRAYLNLDETGVRQNLCADLAADQDMDVVDNYIYNAVQEARQRGFDRTMMKSALYHVETHTIAKTDTTATVRVTGHSKVNICPFFTWIAKIFHIGQTYYVDETLNLVKDGDRWKVCSDLFVLPQSIDNA